MIERAQNVDFAGLKLLLGPEALEERQLIYSAVRLVDPVYQSLSEKRAMHLKFINIVDPTFSKNNLGKSVSKFNASRIKMGLSLMARRVSSLYDKSLSAEVQGGKGCEMLLQGLLQMYEVTFE